MTSADIVNQFIQALERNDLDAALELVTDDVEYDNVPMLKVFGPQAIRDGLGQFFSAFQAIEWVIHHQVAELGYVKNAHLADVDTVSCNVQPRATGQLLIGSCRQFDITHSALDHAMLQRMLARCLAFLPGLAQMRTIRTWTGIEGTMPDDIPVIGASRTTPGLFHAFGFSGHGFQLGPVMGAVLTELIVDGSTPTPIAAFDIGRFAS